MGRAFRPEQLDRHQPPSEGLPEALVSRVMRGSQLALQSVGTEQRYPDDLVPQRPGLPHNPDIEIQQARGVSQGRDDPPLHGNAVLIDLVIETLAERNTILVSM